MKPRQPPVRDQRENHRRGTDVVVIPKGNIAIGTVTDAEHKKRMARGGKLDIEIDYVKLADGEKAAIRAVKETKGGGHTGAMTGAIVATSLVVWPAAPFFLFMHGKDTTIPKGTEITAYVNGNMPLDPVKFTPVAVPARAPPFVTVTTVSKLGIYHFRFALRMGNTRMPISPTVQRGWNPARWLLHNVNSDTASAPNEIKMETIAPCPGVTIGIFVYCLL